jgi:hypothetical protein
MRLTRRWWQTYSSGASGSVSVRHVLCWESGQEAPARYLELLGDDAHVLQHEEHARDFGHTSPAGTIPCDLGLGNGLCWRGCSGAVGEGFVCAAQKPLRPATGQQLPEGPLYAAMYSGVFIALSYPGTDASLQLRCQQITPPVGALTCFVI